MKIKTIFIVLLAVVFVMGLSAPILAQKTTDKKASEVSTKEADETDSEDDLDTADEEEKAEPVKNADYWFDKGALCATYGNDAAAVKFYQKAFSLDPKRSDALFAQGVSYGQLGQFGKAIPLIDRAIKLSLIHI